jgi:hypothetical protein
MLSNIVQEYYKAGKEKEAQFSETLILSEGGRLLPVTDKDDIKKHIDVRWLPSNKNKACTFDVKAAKRKSRYDSSISYSNTWLELRNVNGNPGSLYGEQDYFAFELEYDWVIVRRNELLNALQNNIKDNRVYTNNPQKDFKLYQRDGRQDLIVRVPMSFIINNSRKLIHKRVK